MERITLPSLGLFKRLASHGQRTAVVSSQAQVSYADLLSQASRLSWRIGRSSTSRSKPGKFRPIALVAPRDESYCVGQLAILAAGGAYVPLHTKLPPAEARYILADSECRQAVVHRQFRPALEPHLRELGIEVVDLELGKDEFGDGVGGREGGGGGGADVTFVDTVHESADAMVIYTSGTTGRPKGVVKTHRQLEAMVSCLVEAWDYQPQDRILHLLPLHHLHGVLNKKLCVLWAGGTVEFAPDGAKARGILERLADPTRERLTLFMAVPTIYAQLMEELESPALDAETKRRALEHFRSLRLMVSGSAALPRTLFRKWEEATGHRLLERYGTTEAAMILGNPLHGRRIEGYVGQPMPGVEVRLVDPATEQAVPLPGEGEVRVKGEQLFSRYHNRPEATQEAFDAHGYYKTGDLGAYDAEKGSYRILGRISADIIKSGGYKISALDIEAAILEHPDVAEAVVVGRPHAKWGEEIVAIVRVKKGGGGSSQLTLTLEALHDFLGSRLARYKLPRDLLLVQSIPKNALGKVNKKTVLGALGAGAEEEQQGRQQQ